MTIVITGKNGYVAQRLNSFLPDSETVSVKGLKKEQFTFLESKEIVIHAAALVHKNEKDQTEDAYYEINTNLSYELALRAKQAGVKQFIFLSTMAIYGDVEGEITEYTKTNPITWYGKSKFAAEEKILKLQDEHFKVAIVRPPMIYGPNCPGNYAMLRKVARQSPVFPAIDNKRSMLFIDNLCEMIYQIIKYQDFGIFHPQDPQYIKTSSMVKEIAKIHKRSMFFSKLAGKLLELLIGNTKVFQKVFGDLYYAKGLSTYRDNSYQKFNLEQAIAITERAK